MFPTLKAGLQEFDDHRTITELECYDLGHLHTAKHLLDTGVLESPNHSSLSQTC